MDVSRRAERSDPTIPPKSMVGEVLVVRNGRVTPR
jgi:hypothetical protein